MKYYEFFAPFYALVKAPTKQKAMSIYKKRVWENGPDDWRECSRDYALMRFAMDHHPATTDIPVALNEFTDTDADVLIVTCQPGGLQNAN
ncbi:hypothetical protein DH09_13515 [Bacillaceae bacterium JMAK1]|nr:hypothetical protein DH09_13515 [Bacillaceae bacterium JMAK1]